MARAKTTKKKTTKKKTTRRKAKMTSKKTATTRKRTKAAPKKTTRGGTKVPSRSRVAALAQRERALRAKAQPAVDQHAARDLELYIENDGQLYRSQTTPILANLAKKRRAGKYQHDLAVKLFGYLVESGAKKYAQETGGGQPWNKLFDVPTRRAVAESFTRSFETEYDLGNYDHLAPTDGSARTAPATPAEIRADVARATGVRV